jgi:cellulose biosynthesis protein BcsQ
MMAGKHATALDRETALARVIAVLNDKGGVGKTSVVANVGGQLAEAGYRVLLIDLNRQANLSDDLGVRGTAADDQGCGLRDALIMQGRIPLAVAAGVRPNLDLVSGGKALGEVTTWLIVKAAHDDGDENPSLSLANVLVSVAEHYDLVLIDCPPENVTLGDLALAAARWVIMPTRSDIGGLVGMELVAERFSKAQQINPSLGLLGAVLFGTGTSARAIHKEVGESIAGAFGGTSPLFTSKIRHSERTGVDARKWGKLAHELEADLASQPAWWQALREGSQASGARVSKTSASVAADYRELAVEILTVLREAEAERAGEVSVDA